MGGRMHNPMVRELNSKIEAIKTEEMHRTKTRRFMYKIGSLAKLKQYKMTKRAHCN